ncbi:MAG: stage 0 sporulation protein [Clostridia bacterium]|nr:stage 0 sporulation protein [Clostridia bacterium]
MKVLCVRYVKNARIDYVDPKNYIFKIGDSVVIETERGLEIAKIIKLKDRESLDSSIEIKKICRPASIDDLKKEKENDIEAKEFLKVAKKEAKKLDLNMKFLLAEYTLDKSKLTLYFTSDDRVDFRELVKVLAAMVKTRIELRQIGPRDEIKMYANLGMCGREVCCKTHLKDFKSVTIKDAKEQGLQINMEKLSGACGKLMCCLRYEEEEYKENQKNMPKYNEIVKVIETGEEGKVCNLDILNMRVKVKFGDTRENERYENFDVDKLSWKRK